MKYLKESSCFRIYVEADEYWDVEDMLGDCFDPEVVICMSREKLAAKKKEYLKRLDQNGVVGIILEKYCPHCKEWVVVDALWGIEGWAFDPGNEYGQQLIVDLWPIS